MTQRINNDTGPNWSTLTNIHNVEEVNVSNYPVTSFAGGNNFPVASAVVGAIYVPDNTGADGQANGVGGYAITGGNQAAVGVHGQGMTSRDNANAWGANFAASNAYAQPFPNQTGYSGVNIYGSEIDVSIQKRSNGQAPDGNVYGEYIVGASATRPSGDYNGLHVRAVTDDIENNFTQKWKNGIVVEKAAADVGIDVGAADFGNSKGSMPIQLHTTNSSGADSSAVIAADPYGTIVLRGAQSSGISLQDANANEILSAEPGGVKFKTKYKFKVSINSPQNSGNMAWGTINWGGESFNKANMVSSDTCTIKEDGYYTFGWAVTSLSNANIWIAAMFKNGSEYATGIEQRGPHDPGSSGYTVYDYFYEGDQLQIRVFGNDEIGIDTGAHRTNWWGHIESVE